MVTLLFVFKKYCIIISNFVQNRILNFVYKTNFIKCKVIMNIQQKFNFNLCQIINMFVNIYNYQFCVLIDYN